jgi:hypothetical protein
MARLYTDPALLERFNADPEAEARQAGLSASECAALGRSDRTGLKMAAASFGRKRLQHRRPWLQRMLSRLLRR